MEQKKLEELREILRALEKWIESMETSEGEDSNQKPKPPQQDAEVEQRRKIRDTLQRIGIPKHINGYQYLLYALDLIRRDPSALKKKMNLYEKIAKKFGDTPSSVERSIRNAKDMAWNRGEKDFWKEVFGDKKPANGEFIADIAGYLDFL